MGSSFFVYKNKNLTPYPSVNVALATAGFTGASGKMVSGALVQKTGRAGRAGRGGFA